MPDDQVVTDQVAEQPPVDTTDQVVDEGAAFESEDDQSKAELPADKTEPEKKEDKETPAADEPKDESSAGEGEAPPDEDETDEDILRGKELLAEQEKEAEEKRLKEEADKAELEKSQIPPEKLNLHKLQTEAFDKNAIETFKSIVPENLFPDEPVELSDGTTLDYASLVKEYPEMPSYVAGVANNIVRQMLETGYMVSGEKYQKDVQGIRDSLAQHLFLRDVTHPIYGVPKAKEIVKSKEFNEWLPKQKPEIHAMLKSKDAFDSIKVFKRFLNREVIGGMKVGAEETDNARATAKETFDAAMKKEKSNPSKPGKSNLSGEDEMRIAFESDDDDDI
jgi:hypothetical protein